MGNSEQVSTDKKFELLHQIALTLFQDGDTISALRCWKKIKVESPEFPNIDRWIETAISKDQQNKSSNSAQVDRSVFRKQLEIAEKRGNPVPSQSRFHPYRRDGFKIPRIRHRYIALLLLLGGITCFTLSIKNKQTYKLVLTPNTGKVTCYQGTFFIYGWEKADNLSIGLQQGWEEDLEDLKLKNSLLSGITLFGETELDETLIKFYKMLGQKALQRNSIENQMEAIYYFSQIVKAGYRDKIAWDMATAYYNLADIHFQNLKDYTSARKFLASAREYVNNYPGINNLQKKLSAE